MPAKVDKVVLHPLVLLSVVDHYNRVAKDTRKRVLGVLLGETYKGQVDVTNSFAVPFEEDDADQSIWFLDHSYLENMLRMFKKVNARENVVGWYHTGPRLRAADLDISTLMCDYCDNPTLVICEVEPKEIGLPFTAYLAKDEVREDGTEKSRKVFITVPTEVGQTEAEEIGVEHLLRNVKDATISTLATDVSSKLQALKGLRSRLSEIGSYLELVQDGKLPINHDIMTYLQDIFNLLPNMNVETLSTSLAVKSNDMMGVIYVSSLIRAVLALQRLIDNKEGRMWKEKERVAARGAKKGAQGENGGKENGAEEGAKGEKDGKGGKEGAGDKAALADGSKGASANGKGGK